MAENEPWFTCWHGSENIQTLELKDDDVWIKH